MSVTITEAFRPGTEASPKQISFVRDLIATRAVDADIASHIDEVISLGFYSKSHASADIDAFLKLPKRAKASGGMQALLASVPKSKYAIPAAELELSSIEVKNDLLFVEVKEYMQTLYMRQLHGAPGGFTRTKLTTEQTKDIIAIIAADPYKYTRIFGTHYSCCGSCGAELTDARSRELMLGPECRKKFGH
jgi:hypothetical protein